MYKCFNCDSNVSWKDDSDRRVIDVIDLVFEACVHFHGFTGSFAYIIWSIPIFIDKSGSLNASQAAIAGSDVYGDDQNSEAIDSKNQREIANV